MNQCLEYSQRYLTLKTKRRNLPWIPLDTIPSDIRASRKHDLLNSSESTATFPTNSSPCQGINCHCQFEQSEWKLPAKVTPLSYKSDRDRILNISRGNFSFPSRTICRRMHPRFKNEKPSGTRASRCLLKFLTATCALRGCSIN